VPPKPGSRTEPVARDHAAIGPSEGQLQSQQACQILAQGAMPPGASSQGRTTAIDRLTIRYSDPHGRYFIDTMAPRHFAQEAQGLPAQCGVCCSTLESLASGRAFFPPGERPLSMPAGGGSTSPNHALQSQLLRTCHPW
jgi:hypothetical protein